MKYISEITGLRGIANTKQYVWTVVLAGLLSLPLLGGATAAYGQAPQEPIQGTIEVTEGAEENANWKALAEITPKEARRAALAAVPGATVDEGELDEEGGFLVYEIELTENNEEVEVLIDAGSGEILRLEREREEEEDDDDDGWFDFE